jgi:hypothetical protein
MSDEDLLKSDSVEARVELQVRRPFLRLFKEKRYRIYGHPGETSEPAHEIFPYMLGDLLVFDLWYSRLHEFGEGAGVFKSVHVVPPDIEASWNAVVAIVNAETAAQCGAQRLRSGSINGEIVIRHQAAADIRQTPPLLPRLSPCSISSESDDAQTAHKAFSKIDMLVWQLVGNPRDVERYMEMDEGGGDALARDTQDRWDDAARAGRPGYELLQTAYQVEMYRGRCRRFVARAKKRGLPSFS